MVGRFASDVKHTDHQGLITVEFVDAVSEKWTIIVHGAYVHRTQCINHITYKITVNCTAIFRYASLFQRTFCFLATTAFSEN